MTLLSPLWFQADTFDAREDRQALAVLARFHEHVVRGLEVTQNSAGANMSVDVAAGMAFIEGDDSADQGFYLGVSTTTENRVVAAPPASGTRTDVVVMRVNDAQAGGGAGDPLAIQIITGTAGAGIPAIPDTAIPLAYISVTAGQSSVTNSHLTDVRPTPSGHIWIEPTAPTIDQGHDGDLWLQTTPT